MIPWIQVYSNLPKHPKTTKLADELGLTSASLNPNALAVGLVVSLWTWAIQNSYNGDLSGCSQRAIAEACLWKKKPETLVNALQKAGFLDADMKLHNWEEYTYLLVEQEKNRRTKTRNRVKRYRDKKATETTGDGNVDGYATCNVTDTHCNAPTRHNQTIPDITLSSPDGEDNKTAVVAAVQADYLDRINPSASPASLDELKGYAEELGEAVCKRAFDIALDNKKTTWNYIRAILRDKQAKGVRCLADWEALEKKKKGPTGTAEGDLSWMKEYVVRRDKPNE